MIPGVTTVGEMTVGGLGFGLFLRTVINRNIPMHTATTAPTPAAMPTVVSNVKENDIALDDDDVDEGGATQEMATEFLGDELPPFPTRHMELLVTALTDPNDPDVTKRFPVALHEYHRLLDSGLTNGASAASEVRLSTPPAHALDEK